MKLTEKRKSSNNKQRPKVSSKSEEDKTDAQGQGSELVQVAPNMGAGGSHPQATMDQEWAEELREIRRMIEFLVKRERKLDIRTDVAARRLERLERESSQLEDEEREASLEEALADHAKVVKLTVDKWYASAVQGAEVLVVGSEAWTQVVSDHARAEGGYRARKAWGQRAWKEEKDKERASRAVQQVRRAAALTAELAVQSENKVFEVCSHPPGLSDEPLVAASSHLVNDSPLQSTSSGRARDPSKHASGEHQASPRSEGQSPRRKLQSTATAIEHASPRQHRCAGRNTEALR